MLSILSLHGACLLSGALATLCPNIPPRPPPEHPVEVQLSTDRLIYALGDRVRVRARVLSLPERRPLEGARIWIKLMGRRPQTRPRRIVDRSAPHVYKRLRGPQAVLSLETNALGLAEGTFPITPEGGEGIWRLQVGYSEPLSSGMRLNHSNVAHVSFFVTSEASPLDAPAQVTLRAPPRVRAGAPLEVEIEASYTAEQPLQRGGVTLIAARLGEDGFEEIARGAATLGWQGRAQATLHIPPLPKSHLLWLSAHVQDHGGARGRASLVRPFEDARPLLHLSWLHPPTLGIKNRAALTARWVSGAPMDLELEIEPPHAPPFTLRTGEDGVAVFDVWLFDGEEVIEARARGARARLNTFGARMEGVVIASDATSFKAGAVAELRLRAPHDEGRWVQLALLQEERLIARREVRLEGLETLERFPIPADLDGLARFTLGEGGPERSDLNIWIRGLKALDLDLRVTGEAPRFVEARVTDIHGRPVPGAQVTLDAQPSLLTHLRAHGLLGHEPLSRVRPLDPAWSRTPPVLEGEGLWPWLRAQPHSEGSRAWRAPSIIEPPISPPGWLMALSRRGAHLEPERRAWWRRGAWGLSALLIALSLVGAGRVGWRAAPLIALGASGPLALYAAWRAGVLSPQLEGEGGALILALALVPAVGSLARRRAPRGLGIALAALLGLSALSLTEAPRLKRALRATPLEPPRPMLDPSPSYPFDERGLEERSLRPSPRPLEPRALLLDSPPRDAHLPPLVTDEEGVARAPLELAPSFEGRLAALAHGAEGAMGFGVLPVEAQRPRLRVEAPEWARVGERLRLLVEVYNPHPVGVELCAMPDLCRWVEAKSSAWMNTWRSFTKPGRHKIELGLKERWHTRPRFALSSLNVSAIRSGLDARLLRRRLRREAAGRGSAPLVQQTLNLNVLAVDQQLELEEQIQPQRQEETTESAPPGVTPWRVEAIELEALAEEALDALERRLMTPERVIAQGLLARLMERRAETPRARQRWREVALRAQQRWGLVDEPTSAPRGALMEYDSWGQGEAAPEPDALSARLEGLLGRARQTAALHPCGMKIQQALEIASTLRVLLPPPKRAHDIAVWLLTLQALEIEHAERAQLVKRLARRAPKIKRLESMAFASLALRAAAGRASLADTLDDRLLERRSEWTEPLTTLRILEALSEDPRLRGDPEAKRLFRRWRFIQKPHPTSKRAAVEVTARYPYERAWIGERVRLEIDVWDRAYGQGPPLLLRVPLPTGFAIPDEEQRRLRRAYDLDLRWGEAWLWLPRTRPSRTLRLDLTPRRSVQARLSRPYGPSIKSTLEGPQRIHVSAPHTPAAPPSARLPPVNRHATLGL